MSWIPSPGENILASLEILRRAIRERREAFGVTAYSDLPPPSLPATREAVKEYMSELKNALISLLALSLNPFQFGSWCPFFPFGNANPYALETTAELLERELPSLPCDWGALLLIPPRRVGDHAFVRACGELLDKVILWPSPQWRGFGPGVLGIDAHLFYRDLQYSGQYDADRWQREGSFSVRIGRNSTPVRYDMIARWTRNQSLIYATDHRFLNQGLIRFQGEWQGKYATLAVEEKKSVSTQRTEYAGESRTIRFCDDTSEPILFPFPDSVVQEILGRESTSEFSSHTLSCRIDPENGAFLTRGNMPGINYIYKD